ncbi:hypothetical protein [Bacillus pumilus]|uniref:hypothetical protein n=1 Tax=Bacillus pumilus TaxID=1408 RepID=UPI00227DC28B|nr:hypothetical protein [Bacillus pumilus]MCY7571410.1 hypothetical protein [Bacillus pumilus]MEC3763878.1 hypothetical protein [Bacillus pumilus]
MLDGIQMTFLKIYIVLLSISLIVDVAGYCIRLNQSNDFKQQVNYQIERNGGLNSNALKEIEKKNKEAYGGSFQVHSASLNKTLPYGSEVSYKITTTYNFQLGGHKEVIEVKGGALSLIR